MLVSLAVAALVRCAAPSPEVLPVAADGRIALADGTRVRVPDGLRPFAAPRTGDEPPITAMLDAGGTTLVTASSTPAPAAALSCDGPAAEERGLVPFRTDAHLPACLFSAADARSGGALALALVHTEEDVISVSVVAPAEERARRLAREVARSVLLPARRVIARPPGTWEPSLTGCWKHDRLESGFAGSLVVVTMRCFSEDHAFNEVSKIGVTTSAGSRLSEKEANGVWRLVGRRLLVGYEDGGTWDDDVSIDDDGLQVGGERWRRVE